VLNNGGYGTERRLLDGPFNDLQPWQYGSIPEIVGGGRGFVINTEDEFDKALEAANEYLEGFSILDVRLDPNMYNESANIEIIRNTRDSIKRSFDLVQSAREEVLK
jgi:TPP-dependent 2-oxoacid decarboxylase